MIELSLAENQQISTLNTSGYVNYVRKVLGEEALDGLFQGVLDDSGFSVNRVYLGRPVDIHYFLMPDNWIDNELSLQFFANLDSLGVDLLELGRAVVTERLMRKGRIVIGMIHLQGIGATFNGVQKVNALYNRTKDVTISGIQPTGGMVHLAYRKGIPHTEHVTHYNVGVYLGALDYLGYEDASYKIESNTYGDSSVLGETTVQFNWAKKSILDRLMFLIGGLMSRRIFRSYLKSSQFIHEFHGNLLEDYHFQISRKNELLKEREANYKNQLNLKNRRIADQESVISQQSKELAVYLDKFKLNAEAWLRDYACQQDVSVTDFAKHLNVTERTLNRKLTDIYGKSAKELIMEWRIERAKSLLPKMSVTAVSHSTGFNSSPVFSRAFKKATGLPPKQYADQKSTTKCPK